MRYLIFDIETVPLTDLPEPLELEVARRTKREVEKGEVQPSEAEVLVRSVSPFFGRVLAIGMRLHNDKSGENKDKIISEATEEDTLQAFFETVNHPASQDLRYVHYNGLGFDVPFLIIRAAIRGITISSYRFLNQRRFSYDPHVDVMQFLSRWGREGVSLDLACRSFGIPSPKEGEVKGETVAAAFERGDLEAVREYVMRDVEATHRLFLKIKEYL
ncbi:MAG: ribonuclease H-like domain-containing protein [Fidelibacterota bacterium]|nr:MAG: ribonuclease H-like domain-containing protein [Candidatus Neomarinimicrobiota bacterium]